MLKSCYDAAATLFMVTPILFHSSRLLLPPSSSLLSAPSTMPFCSAACQMLRSPATPCHCYAACFDVFAAMRYAAMPADVVGVCWLSRCLFCHCLPRTVSRHCLMAILRLLAALRCAEAFVDAASCAIRFLSSHQIRFFVYC